MNKAYKQTKQYHKADHLVYSCQYHVIFCPKYRRKILNEGRDVRLKEVFWDTAARHGFSILEMEVMPDHVHLLVDCDPRYGIAQCLPPYEHPDTARCNDTFEIFLKFHDICIRELKETGISRPATFGL